MTLELGDPQAYVQAPIVAALNRIVLRALMGLGLVVALTTTPLLIPLDRAVHEVVHLALPVGWVAYAIATAVLLAMQRGSAAGDGWRRATDVDAGLAGLARLTSAMMQVGWVVSVAAVLVHHHLTSQPAVLATVIVDIPLMLSVWILATFAWTRWCEHSLGRAEEESTRRLRWYWGHATRRGR